MFWLDALAILRPFLTRGYLVKRGKITLAVLTSLGTFGGCVCCFIEFQESVCIQNYESYAQEEYIMQICTCIHILDYFSERGMTSFLETKSTQ